MESALNTRRFGANSGYWVFLALVITLGAFYAPTWITIAGEWTESGAYNHGFLGLLVAVYILWERRAALVNTSSRNEWLFLILLFGAALVYWLASEISIQVLRVFALFTVLCLSLVTIYGRERIATFWLPLLVVFLVLPIWDFLQSPLQLASTEATEYFLRLASVPVFRDEFVLAVPGGKFIVEEGCSGLGFLLCSVLLAVLYNHYNHMVGPARYLIVGLSIAFAIISNWIRIIAIVLIGNYTNMEHPFVEDHLTFGWFVFSALMIPFYYLLIKIFPSQSPSPVTHTVDSAPSKQRPETVLAFLVIVAFPLLNWLNIFSYETAEADPVLDSIHVSLSPKALKNGDWRPQYDGADYLEVSRVPFFDQPTLMLIVRYDAQHQGEELIYIGNRLFDDDKWKLVETIQEEKFQLIRLQRAEKKRDIIFWYMINGKTTVNSLEAKMLELEGVLTGDRRAYLFALAEDNPVGALSESYLISKAQDLQDQVAGVVSAP